MSIQFSHKQRDSLKVNYGAPRRVPPKIRWILLVLLLSLPLLYVIFNVIQHYLFIRFPGQVIFDTYTVRAPDDGYIAQLYVKVGEKVQPQQPLLWFNSPELDIKINYFKKELKTLSTLVNHLNTHQQPPFEVMQELLEKDITMSKEVYDKFKQYAKAGHMALLQLEEARQHYFEAQQQLDELKKEALKYHQTTFTNVEVNFKRRMREIKNELQRLAVKKQHLKLGAPKAGSVMQIITYEKEFIATGQPLLSIVTTDNMQVTTYIEPRYLDKVYPGRSVLIKFPNHDSIPGEIINTPTYTEKFPSFDANPLSTPQNKLVALVKPLAPIPKPYQVFGIPVKIVLK